MENPVSWTFSQERVSENEFILKFEADLEKGWYIYSQNIEEGGPIPTTFTFFDNTAVKTLGTVKEDGKLKSGYDAMFDMDINKYADKVSFSQKVSITENTSFSGELEFMCCDAEKCLPPAYEEFSFDLSIQKEEAATEESTSNEETEEPAEAKTEAIPADNEQEAKDENAEEAKSGFLKPVKWSFEQKQIDENTFELISSTTIDEGWYMYSQTIPAGGPPSTYFEISLPEGAELVGQMEEGGNIKTMYDKVFDMELVKFTKKAIFTQRIKSTTAEGQVPFYIEYVS
jgi:thiol:disulfide interchange protein DsbD